MCKIFYIPTTDYLSEESVKKILSEYFGIPDAVISRTKNGKPYAENAPHFSVSHTLEKAFIVFSSSNVGIDTELLSRKIDYATIVKRFSKEERNEIECVEDFLKNWVVKESAVKFLGGTIARDFKKLAYMRNRLYYDGVPLPVCLTFFQFEGHLLSLCGETDFSDAEFIQLTL